jgi:DNA modification methylase
MQLSAFPNSDLFSIAYYPNVEPARGANAKPNQRLTALVASPLPCPVNDARAARWSLSSAIARQRSISRCCISSGLSAICRKTGRIATGNPRFDSQCFFNVHLLYAVCFIIDVQTSSDLFYCGGTQSMNRRVAPGVIRDSIVSYLSAAESASIAEIQQAVVVRLGDVPASSVRSYLNLNTPDLFERTARGHYRLQVADVHGTTPSLGATYSLGRATLIQGNCFEWMRSCEPHSIHAVITDPPYGLLEYSHTEQVKLRIGRGGVWRIPPSFDGHQRAPLPRFTVLDEGDRQVMHDFFHEFGQLVLRITVPGANVLVASNPLLAHIVANAMSMAGLELRGQIVRLVMTMRGGDRPKNAHKEFSGVSVMPRSMFEPWIILRHPLDGRVQDNLRQWNTGGFRRPSDERPFGDVIKSRPTPKQERKIAPHPSLKPQGFLRAIVRAALPRAEGVILDPFAGSGSTLAAANAIGYDSIGLEKDSQYVALAKRAIPELSALSVREIDPIGT